MATCGSSKLTNNQPQDDHYSANFKPSLWGDRFTTFTLDNELLKKYNKEVEMLKEEVKGMLVSVSGKSREAMILINTLERLGVAYLFEKEIEEELAKQFSLFKDNDCDLFLLALQFRIFRQHGYKIPCEVFNKFRNENGEFEESIRNDVMGMLSLYEATYLKIHGEDDLDEALAFTKAHLESLLSMAPESELISSLIADQVMHALNQPLHRGIPRVEARYYISVYAKDDSRNEKLLRLAKVDFNRLQLLHRQELSLVCRWWKESLMSQVSYMRQRIVEFYFWSAASYFEPQYALARILLTKVFAMITAANDTYDSYGTYDELKLFTKAIDRWDMSEIEELPSYMKTVFRVLLNLYDEITDKDMELHGTSCGSDLSKETYKDYVRAYDIDREWVKEGYVPTFEEYMRNTLRTSMDIILRSSFLGMPETDTAEAFEWIRKKPKISKACLLIGRIDNDIVSHERERKAGKISAVECYMKQFGVSKEEAYHELYTISGNAWKDINEEMLRPTAISMHFLLRIINQARLINTVYLHNDAITDAEYLENHITSLYINPIP